MANILRITGFLKDFSASSSNCLKLKYHGRYHGNHHQFFNFLLFIPSNLLTIFQINISWFCIITRMLLHYAEFPFTFRPNYFAVSYIVYICRHLRWKLKSSERDDRWKYFSFLFFPIYFRVLLHPLPDVHSEVLSDKKS